MSRKQTTGVVEHSFTFDEGTRDEMTLVFVDVAGQRNKRKKWIDQFDNVTAVIFLVAVSEYNQVILPYENSNPGFSGALGGCQHKQADWVPECVQGDAAQWILHRDTIYSLSQQEGPFWDQNQRGAPPEDKFSKVRTLFKCESYQVQVHWAWRWRQSCHDVYQGDLPCGRFGGVLKDF